MRGYDEVSGEDQGFINWPDPATKMVNTCEGGLATFLVLPEDDKGVPWTQCGVNMPRMRIQSVIVRGQEEIERALFGVSQYDRNGYPNHIRELVLAMCIGSTGASWHSQEGGYFKPGYSDLTEDGQALYGLLSKLYGRKPYFLTLLDT